jgi:hypothetical protein
LTGTGPFGFLNLYKIIKAKNNKQFLELFHRRHAEFGATYVNQNMSRRLVITNDPANIKTALSTRFEDWYVLFIQWRQSASFPELIAMNLGASRKSAKAL